MKKKNKNFESKQFEIGQPLLFDTKTLEPTFEKGYKKHHTNSVCPFIYSFQIGFRHCKPTPIGMMARL